MRAICTFLSILLLTSFSPPQSSLFVIKGRVVGSDAKPIAFADVHCLSNSEDWPRRAIKSSHVAPNGTYELRFDFPGLYRLQFAGVGHNPIELPVLLAKYDTVLLSVRLSAHELRDSLTTVWIIGDFNNFSLRAPPLFMTKQRDGTFAITLRTIADSLSYQIRLADKVRTAINGTQSDRYIWTPEGDYRSVVRTRKDDSITIVFAPNRLSNVHSDPIVAFQDEGSLTSRFYAIETKLGEFRNRRADARREFSRSGKKPSAFIYDSSHDRAEILRLREKEHDPVLRNAWLLAAVCEFPGAEADSSLATLALKSISPMDPFWYYNPRFMSQCVDASRDQRSYLSYLQQAIAGHHDKEIIPYLIYTLLSFAKHSRADSLLATYYRVLASEYPNSPWSAAAKSTFAPSRSIQVGKAVPDFSVASLEDSTVLFTRKNLLGTVYLIDFWATWCVPCVAELKHLSQAYERFRSKGFTILSASFDGKPEVVGKFRKEKYPMPWLHTRTLAREGDQFANLFEVAVIPKPILVGRDGTILAIEDDLFGEKLPASLLKVLGH